ncbi:hypothetical protein [Leisingera aquaemixtae]|nr:hypothetical protein [Leisingera aquaemixtae]
MVWLRFLTLCGAGGCWQDALGNRILSINGDTGGSGDGALKRRISRRQSDMPMVRKTALSQAFAAGLTLALAAGQPGSAEEWARPLFSNQTRAVSGIGTGTGAAEPQAFQLAFIHEFGSLILGGTVSSNRSGILTRAVQAEETHQLRLHAGYDFGPATGVVTLGGVQAEGSGGRRQGTLFGLGMRVSLNRALQLRGEVLHHEAGPRDGSGRPRGETLSVSAAFRF